MDTHPAADTQQALVRDEMIVLLWSTSDKMLEEKEGCISLKHLQWMCRGCLLRPLNPTLSFDPHSLQQGNNGILRATST